MKIQLEKLKGLKAYDYNSILNNMLYKNDQTYQKLINVGKKLNQIILKNCNNISLLDHIEQHNCDVLVLTKGITDSEHKKTDNKRLYDHDNCILFAARYHDSGKLLNTQHHTTIMNDLITKLCTEEGLDDLYIKIILSAINNHDNEIVDSSTINIVYNYKANLNRIKKKRIRETGHIPMEYEIKECVINIPKSFDYLVEANILSKFSISYLLYNYDTTKNLDENVKSFYNILLEDFFRKVYLLKSESALSIYSEFVK